MYVSRSRNKENETVPISALVEAFVSLTSSVTGVNVYTAVLHKQSKGKGNVVRCIQRAIESERIVSAMEISNVDSVDKVYRIVTEHMRLVVRILLLLLPHALSFNFSKSHFSPPSICIVGNKHTSVQMHEIIFPGQSIPQGRRCLSGYCSLQPSSFSGEKPNIISPAERIHFNETSSCLRQKSFRRPENIACPCQRFSRRCPLRLHNENPLPNCVIHSFHVNPHFQPFCRRFKKNSTIISINSLPSWHV